MSNDQTSIALSLGNFSNKKLADYPEFIKTILLIKKSAAMANYKTGLITESECQTLIDTCDRVAEIDFDEFLVEPHLGGGGIAVHQNINELLSRYSGLVKEKINQSQSTSDVGHTAFRITLQTNFKNCKKNIEAIQSSYERICTQWRNIKTVAHTCLRDAGETTLGHFFSGHADLFNRRILSLEKSIESLEINIGGTVFGNKMGTTSDYQKFAFEELQKNCDRPLKLSANLYDRAQNSDDLAEVSNQFSQLAKAMLKIFQDTRLLYSGPDHGINAIELKPIMKGSSFFSNKSNPILPETMIQAALLMLGKDHAIQMALLQSELDLNVFDFFMGFLLLDQTEILSKILPLWQQTIDSMELTSAKS